MTLGHRAPSRRRPSLAHPWGALLVPLVTFLAVVYVLPLVGIGVRAFSDPPGIQLGHFTTFLTDTAAIRSLGTTFRAAGSTTLVCLLVGYPYAYLMWLAPRRVVPVLLIIVLVPFWTSTLVRTYAWQVILRDTGIINQWLLGNGIVEEPVPLIRTTFGVILGMTYIMLPLMVLLIYASMRQIDPAFGRAAATLGASPVRSFFKVFLPLSLGGVAAGALLVFVQSLGFYITPALLGSPQDQMLSQVIVGQVNERLDWGYAGALSLILLTMTLLVLWVAARFVRIRDVFGVGAGDVLR